MAKPRTKPLDRSRQLLYLLQKVARLGDREEAMGDAKDPRDVLAAGVPGIEVDEFGGWCPVQVTGMIDGLPFYFRARGDAWRLNIADAPGGDAVGVGFPGCPGWSYGENWGTWPDAGYMPDDIAIGFIEASIGKWRAEKGVPR
jgi:hypothetical protein